MTNQRPYYTEHRVRFEFRKSQVCATLPGTIYAVIYVEGQPPEMFSTGIRCARADYEARGTSRSSESVKQLERSLVLWKEAVFSAARSLYAEGKPLTAQALIEEKNYASQPLLTAEQIFQKFLAFKRQRIGPDRAELRSPGQICLSTFKQYEHRWHTFRDFLKHKRKEKVLLSAIDSPLIQQFYHFMLNQSIAPATATKRVKIVTEVCQWALNEGLIRELRTAGFRGVSAAEKPPYNVSEEEVHRIESIDMPATLARFRDGWLLARELCLHYSDYLDVKPHHFGVDKKGRLVFDKARIKQEAGRDIRQVCLVSERALSIWYRHGQSIPCRAQNPVFSRYLKEIGAMAELSQPLTFSHARDSGIFKLVAGGCPDFVTKLAAGWTTQKQLTRYVRHDRRLLEEYDLPPTYVNHAEAISSAYDSLTSQNLRIPSIDSGTPVGIEQPLIEMKDQKMAALEE